MLALHPHSMNQFLTHSKYRVSKLHGMIVNSASKLLQICIQTICKSIIKLHDLYSLLREVELYRSININIQTSYIRHKHIRLHDSGNAFDEKYGFVLMDTI